MARRFPFLKAKYTGQPRLIEAELAVNYGSGKTIFIEHMNDLFAEKIPADWVYKVMAHADKFPDNKYIYQTKNPERAAKWYSPAANWDMFGTTIETNRDFKLLSNAPSAVSRVVGMMKISVKKFVTIEPILDFDVDIMVGWMKEIRPEFVNIGADSKGCGLPEPPAEKVRELIAKLGEAKITIKKKTNLERLLRGKS